MKHIKRLSVLSLLLLFLLAPSVTAAASEGDGVTVYDQAGVLSASTETALSFFSDPHGTRLCFVSAYGSFSRSEIMKIFGIRRGDSAVVLAVERTSGDNYYYEMFTYGHADKILSQRACDSILDAQSVYGNIKSGRVGEGARAFFSLTVSALDEAWREPTPLWLSALITALVVALLVGGGSVLGVWLCYRKKRRGVSYPLNRYANLHLTHAEDRFVGSSVVRTRVQTSSTNGGRSSSSGGGSRGRR